jgi:hypothetical protein
MTTNVAGQTNIGQIGESGQVAHKHPSELAPGGGCIIF